VSHLIEIRRFYGVEHGGGYDAWRKTSVLATPFDFDKAQSTRPKGHCVAVRVTSEDPDDGFKPTSGKVQVNYKSNSNIIFYFIHPVTCTEFKYLCRSLTLKASQMCGRTSLSR